MRTAKSRKWALAATLMLAGMATGCTADPLAAQYGAGDGKNYIAGSGVVTEVAQAERGEPVDFESVDENGDSINADQYRGEVLVVNFWYAACPPCRVEAPDLESVYTDFKPDNVAFMGVNTHDSAKTTLSFMDNLGVSYPSAIDINTGAVQLAFAGNMAPNSTPSTMIVDRQGRVAARILGQIDPGILSTLIRETVAEDISIDD